MKAITIGILARVAVALALAGDAGAQTVAGDRFTLNTGPCTIRSGAGAPEGRQTGKVCDIYIRTDGTGAAIVYVKDSGTGATGWQTLTPGIPLDPTPGKVLASGSPVTWTPTPSLTAITGAGDLTLNPTGNLITSPGGRTIAPALPFTTSIGMLSRKYLALHASELWVETLVAQQTLATIGGRVVVAPTNVLARDVAPGDTQIYVKYPSFLLHVSGVELGSKLFLESGGKFEAMTVLSTSTPPPEPDGSYSYGVARNTDGSGANQWYAGDAILDTGKQTTASGFLDLYATRGLVSGTGPTLVGNVRTGQQYNEVSPRFALGNLNGIGYGHTSDIYGFAAGDPNGPNIFADAVNGLHLRYGTAGRVSLYPDGRAVFTGDGNGVTNINGGNIAASTITGDKIAASTITAGNLNATGFGDNMIKNGTFEPNVGLALSDPSSLSGWTKDLSSTNVGLQNSCCGIMGPGTLMLDPGDGLYMSAEYLAFPVTPGETYRVAFRSYGRASAVATHVLMYESSSNGSVRYVRNSGSNQPFGPGDVASESYTFLAINAPIGPEGYWRTHEYLYTVPTGIRWVSLGLYDLSGSVSGSTYTPIYFDDVQVARQIGPGSIKASAITADKIAAGAITANALAVGTGSNFLRNSECRTSTAEWYLEGDAGTPTFGYNYSPDWSLLSEPSVCYTFYTTAPPAGSFLQARGKDYPAIAGSTYEASAYLGMHRASGFVILLFLNAAGTPLAQYNGNTCAAANNGGVAISNYCRSGTIGAAPSGTTTVRMYVRTMMDGSAQPVTFWVRAFLAEGKPYQTQLSEWSPAGLTEINGALITTGAIQAQHIAASTITGDKIAARTLVGSHLQIGTIGAAEIATRSLTADTIAVGAITSTEIAGRSITADRIVSGTIGANEIAGGAITGDRIAGNTITGSNIAAGQITADKLNVGSLSAISANLGSVNAGTITGVTINGVTISGSTIYAGPVTLDGGGITIAAGGASENKLKWSGGGSIWSNSNTIQLETNTVQATQNLGVNGYIFAGGSFPGGGGEYVMYNAGCGCFARYASSIRYKENIRPWSPIDPLAILRVPLIRHDYRIPPNAPPGFVPDRNVVGLLVEDLIKLAPDAVIVDALGRPDAIRGGAIDLYLIAALRAEDARIADLERRLRLAEDTLRRIGGGK